MGLLLLDRAQLEVKTEGETLVLYEAGIRCGTVPIKLVDRCVIFGSQVSLDSGVLIKLADAGATVTFISTRAPRKMATLLGPQHNDASVRLAQSHRVLDDVWCRTWALSVVRAKLSRQCKVLRLMLEQRPDLRKPILDSLDAIAKICNNLDGVAKDEKTLLPLDTLRGMEGAAARAYFAGMAAVMPPALHFSGRNRRPPKDPVNVCLSLGYTLLHSQAIQACMIAGLDPLLGFYHRPSFGRESLASDLIEALRPAVDLWVWNVLRRRVLNSDHFTFSPDAGGCLLGKAGRSIYFCDWKNHSKPWQRWLNKQAQALARDLRGTGSFLMETEPVDDESC